VQHNALSIGREGKDSQMKPAAEARISHVSLDQDTSRLVDDWRRQQEHIPPRREAVRELVRQALTKTDAE
jgi:hypothetical protein